jgi:hypothetical protein
MSQRSEEQSDEPREADHLADMFHGNRPLTAPPLPYSALPSYYTVTELLGDGMSGAAFAAYEGTDGLAPLVPGASGGLPLVVKVQPLDDAAIPARQEIAIHVALERLRDRHPALLQNMVRAYDWLYCLANVGTWPGVAELAQRRNDPRWLVPRHYSMLVLERLAWSLHQQLVAYSAVQQPDGALRRFVASVVAQFVGQQEALGSLALLWRLNDGHTANLYMQPVEVASGYFEYTLALHGHGHEHAAPAIKLNIDVAWTGGQQLKIADFGRSQLHFRTQPGRQQNVDAYSPSVPWYYLLDDGTVGMTQPIPPQPVTPSQNDVAMLLESMLRPLRHAQRMDVVGALPQLQDAVLMGADARFLRDWPRYSQQAAPFVAYLLHDPLFAGLGWLRADDGSIVVASAYPFAGTTPIAPITAALGRPALDDLLLLGCRGALAPLTPNLIGGKTTGDERSEHADAAGTLRDKLAALDVRIEELSLAHFTAATADALAELSLRRAALRYELKQAQLEAQRAADDEAAEEPGGRKKTHGEATTMSLAWLHHQERPLSATAHIDAAPLLQHYTVRALLGVGSSAMAFVVQRQAAAGADDPSYALKVQPISATHIGFREEIAIHVVLERLRGLHPALLRGVAKMQDWFICTTNIASWLPAGTLHVRDPEQWRGVRQYGMLVLERFATTINDALMQLAAQADAPRGALRRLLTSILAQFVCTTAVLRGLLPLWRHGDAQRFNLYLEPAEVDDGRDYICSVPGGQHVPQPAAAGAGTTAAGADGADQSIVQVHIDASWTAGRVVKLADFGRSIVDVQLEEHAGPSTPAAGAGPPKQRISAFTPYVLAYRVEGDRLMRYQDRTYANNVAPPHMEVVQLLVSMVGSLHVERNNLKSRGQPYHGDLDDAVLMRADMRYFEATGRYASAASPLLAYLRDDPLFVGLRIEPVPPPAVFPAMPSLQRIGASLVDV